MREAGVQSQARQPLSVKCYQLLPLQALGITGIELGKVHAVPPVDWPSAVVFTAYAAAWPKVIETGIGTAVMRHLAREESYYYLLYLTTL